MNPDLALLQPYPFEKLRALTAGVEAPTGCKPIRLSIGEPQHATPQFIKDALAANLAGLANYPATLGTPALRQAIAAWVERRFGVSLSPDKQILPAAGTREALFAIAQCVIDRSRAGALVLCPNPFYQIYEGAALLAGSRPVFYNQTPENGFACAWENIPTEQWARTQLVYVCSPGNPTGRVLSLDEWRTLFELSDRHGFVVAADECYSEIYFDESNPPLGALSAARALGRLDFQRLVVFSSLSKRSNVPGLRSGFVAGDATIIEKFLLYRTYHGCALSPPVQEASIRAWNDEAHVVENRRLYREKFTQLQPILGAVMPAPMPDASFYLWARTPGADTDFARDLLAATGVSVLPGSYLARESAGINPGAGFVRIALVAEPAECAEGIARIVNFCRTL
ncbi:MAG: succinyldiaminopimelate transaminase [Rhodocyclaceae bacterium]|nr:succinyldiaminopimelate transaminase [Rhodocyclaceae bacterium]MBX3669286.1 succinyldiaminopimelate transaminase [Rhodocyclaceae bacterium]